MKGRDLFLTCLTLSVWLNCLDLCGLVIYYLSNIVVICKGPYGYDLFISV